MIVVLSYHCNDAVLWKIDIAYCLVIYFYMPQFPTFLILGIIIYNAQKIMTRKEFILWNTILLIYIIRY